MTNNKQKTIIWTGREKEIVFEKELKGEGEELTLLMLLVGTEDSSVRVSVKVKHVARNTKSKVIVKGVLDDTSKIDFEGLTKIEKGAGNSNAWLESRLLMLSDQASGTAVPNMEISENEVKAGHGATVGKIDEIEIFYLMSRGLTREKARRLIVQGFVGELISQMGKDITKEIVRQIKWLV